MAGHRVAGSHTGPPVLLLVEPLLVVPELLMPLDEPEEEDELDIVPLLDDCAPPVPPVLPPSRWVTSWIPSTSEQPPEAASAAAARNGHLFDERIRGLL